MHCAATQRSRSARAASDCSHALAPRDYTARIDTVKGKVTRGDKTDTPFPVFCLMEEAHNYAPANADAVTTEILKTVLSEGRKFGVSIGLITQRPGQAR